MDENTLNQISAPITREEFHSKPLSQKRITIAQDAINLVKQNIVKVKKGAYINAKGFHPGATFYENNLKWDFRTSFLNSSCTVCAKGALFLAISLKLNSYDMSIPSPSYTSTIDEKQIDKVVCEREQIFTPEEFKNIEREFEGWGPYNYHKIYEDPKVRLTAILLNIIQHDGIFIPENHVPLIEVLNVLGIKKEEYEATYGLIEQK